MINLNVPELELRILKIMWDSKNPLTVQSIIDSWKYDPTPGYTTILKKLQIMEEKGYIDHKKAGRAYSYFPIIRKNQVSKRKFKDLLSDMFGGNKIEMAASFIEDTQLTKEEVEELKKLLDKGLTNE